jgi:hypothetical protein
MSLNHLGQAVSAENNPEVLLSVPPIVFRVLWSSQFMEGMEFPGSNSSLPSMVLRVDSTFVHMVAKMSIFFQNIETTILFVFFS